MCLMVISSSSDGANYATNLENKPFCVLKKCLHKNTQMYYTTFFEPRYGAKEMPLKSEDIWNRELDTNIQWKEQYERFAPCTNNTTLLWFQDKLMDRILTTNTFIAKFTTTVRYALFVTMTERLCSTCLLPAPM